jgi:hypothetical protein
MTSTLTHRLQDERLAAGLTLLLATAGLALANFAGSGENGGPAEYAVSLAVDAALTAWLFVRVVPRAADPARLGWVLAALAAVTCAVFWSGLPFVLGLAAASAAARAHRTGPAVIGVLAALAAFVGCAVG